MVDMIIHDATSREAVVDYIDHLSIEGQNWDVSINPHSDKRTLAQNALAFKWYQEIAAARQDMTVNEVRAECKLTFGVPILRRDNEKFRESYDRCLADKSYESQMEFIEFTELPVTRIMNKKQLSEYMDKIDAVCRQRGIILTHPEDALRNW